MKICRQEEDFIFHNTDANKYKYKCDKYNVEGCQKNLSHPNWPPIVINRYIDVANNGKDRIANCRCQLFSRN